MKDGLTWVKKQLCVRFLHKADQIERPLQRLVLLTAHTKVKHVLRRQGSKQDYNDFVTSQTKVT